MTYTLASIKTVRGMEGPGFNSNLMHDGKRVGTIDDDGNGGCYRVHIEPAHRQPFADFIAKWYADTNQAAKHEKDMREFGIENIEPQAPHDQIEAWANELFMRWAAIKDIKRWSKTKTIFMLEGDKDGEYHTLTKPYSAGAEAFIRNKYGAKVKGIYNPADESTVDALL